MNLTIKKEKIQFGETKVLGLFTKAVKFWVAQDIPDGVLQEYSKIKSNDTGDDSYEAQKVIIDSMRNVVVSLLEMNNGKRKVKKFVKDLGFKGINKVYLFLNEYINNVEDEKKND